MVVNTDCGFVRPQSHLAGLKGLSRALNSDFERIQPKIQCVHSMELETTLRLAANSCEIRAKATCAMCIQTNNKATPLYTELYKSHSRDNSDMSSILVHKRLRDPLMGVVYELKLNLMTTCSAQQKLKAHDQF